MILVISILYTASFIIGAFYTFPLVHNNWTQTLNKNDENKIFQLLQNMKDDENCFYCIRTYSKKEDIDEMIANQQRLIQHNDALKVVRILLNWLSIINTLVAIIVFGGPVLIICAMIISATLIFASLFINNSMYMIYFESSVIVASVVVWIKSDYCLFITILCKFIHNQSLQDNINMNI